MKGKILQDYIGNSLHGIPQFLATWQEDAVTAVAECSMGDRDTGHSYYVSRLIDDGYILRDEVERACVEWFRQERFAQQEVPIRRIMRLQEILNIAIRCRMGAVFTQLALQFEALGKIAVTDDMLQHSFITAVAFGNPDGVVRKTLIILFDELYWTDNTLFKLLYFNHASVGIAEREAVLEHLCLKCRRIKKATGNNIDVVSDLRFMLYDHFDSNWGNNGPNRFLHTKARTDEWLALHAAECSFPVRGERRLRQGK